MKTDDGIPGTDGRITSGGPDAAAPGEGVTPSRGGPDEFSPFGADPAGGERPVDMTGEELGRWLDEVLGLDASADRESSDASPVKHWLRGRR